LSIKILSTDSCGKQKTKGLCPLQKLRRGVSTARVSGGRKSELGRWPGCSQCNLESVSRKNSYI